MDHPLHTNTIDALETALAALGAIDHGERDGLTHRERLRVVELAGALVDRATALRAVVVDEADRAGSAQVAAGTPLTSWLANHNTLDARQAAAVVFAGRALAEHGLVRDAALQGRVSVQQARVVGEVIDRLPDTLTDAQLNAVADDLVTHAAAIDAKRPDLAAREALQRVAPACVPDAVDELAALADQKRRARARRGLSFGPARDGSVEIRGSLPVVDAAELQTMVNAAAEQLRRDQRESRERLDPLQPCPTSDQWRADGLMHLVRTWATAEHVPNVAGDRPRIVVLMAEAQLRERAEQAGLLASGEPIDAGDLRRLCCDADLTPVVLGGASEILDVGRTHRLVTPAIRQTLTLRDGGCVFPGCAASPERCQAHHVTPWAWGGVTALNELVLVCPFHHALVEPKVRPGDGPPPDLWEIGFDEHDLPYLLPPRRMDAERRPLRNTRRRLVA